MKYLLSFLFAFSSVVLSAQNKLEVSVTPFLQNATKANNVNEISYSQAIQVRYVRNQIFLEVGMEMMQFSDNAFVIDQITNSISFPRKGNEYKLNYLNIGLGYRSNWFKGLFFDNSISFGFAINKNYSAAKPIANSIVITANQSKEESISSFKPSMQNKLFYVIEITDRIACSAGLVLQSNFSPLVSEELTSAYFLSNKTVDINYQLGLTFTMIYTFK